MLWFGLGDEGTCPAVCRQGGSLGVSQSSGIVINKSLWTSHSAYSSVHIRSRISSKYCYTKDDGMGCLWGPLHYIP